MRDTRKATSGQNFEVVRDVYEAGDRSGDWNAVFRLAHSDIEWATDRAHPAGYGSSAGPSGGPPFNA